MPLLVKSTFIVFSNLYKFDILQKPALTHAQHFYVTSHNILFYSNRMQQNIKPKESKHHLYHGR